MVVILQTAVTLKIGETGKEMTIPNVKRIVYEPVPNANEIRPINVLNQSPPIDFLNPHKFIRGEIQCASEAHTAFYSNTGTGTATVTAKQYINPSGDNLTIPSVIVTAQDKNGQTWTYTFTGLFPVDEALDLDVGEGNTTKEVVTVYPFVAKYVTITGPA